MTRRRRGARVSGVPVPLRWWWDSEPSILRRRAGRGFSYTDPDGARIADGRQLRRIRALAVPPAWSDVRICPWPDGHLQAVGRDARGRKQYRYHTAFREGREAAKFDAIARFGAALPAIRRRVAADLDLPGMPRDKVLALVVRLLDLTRLRVGNEEYRRDNRSYGLTTLLDRHARVDGGQVRLRFRGKSGVVQEATIADRRIARLVRRCQELPGQELFAYVDDEGNVRHVRSEDVNAYLRAAGGDEVSARLFRTWGATVEACRALADGAATGTRAETGPDGSDPGGADPGRATPRARRSALNEAMRVVAADLGNTVAVARRSYVHPAIPRAHDAGTLPDTVARARLRARHASRAASPTGLTPDEQATLAVLEAAMEPGRDR